MIKACDGSVCIFVCFYQLEPTPECPQLGEPLEQDLDVDTAVFLIDRRLGWVHFLTKGLAYNFITCY